MKPSRWARSGPSFLLLGLDRALRWFGSAPAYALTDNEQTVSIDQVCRLAVRELEAACEAFCDRVNTREHRVTRPPPVVTLADERERLTPLPSVPRTDCFGQTTKVSWQSTISVGGALYLPVPSRLVVERVSARV